MPQEAVPEIQWFKTAYVVAEDRLRLTCTLKTGDTDVVWITQRLANALAKNLLEWLDKTIGEERFPDLAHEMAQRAATAKPAPKPTSPLAANDDVHGWLASAVVFKTAGKVLVLTFKDQGDQRAVFIRFDAQHLRRWLKVFHAQYARAGWPTDVWPDWLRDTGKIKTGVQSGLLH